jgi:thioredoxin reductase
VILATGVTDRWVLFPGYEDYVGKTMHHCIVCDGYEVGGSRVLVVGTDDEAAEMAVQLLAHTDQVTLLCEGGPEALPKAKLLAKRGIEVVPGCITAASARPGAPGYFAAVTLDTGRELAVDHVFSVQGAVPNTQLAEGLGVTLTDKGYIKVDTEAHTSVPGVFAAGDVTRLFSHLVITAAHEGAAAALAVDYWLYQQDGERAALSSRGP